MRSLNKTTSLMFFLLTINAVCVVCPTGCEKEVYSEFNNARPLDDFLHAFLNIKFEAARWNSTTNTNEHIYCGFRDALNDSAKGYYFDMFYSVQDMNLPHLLPPVDFCSINHENEKNDCIQALLAIGCKNLFDEMDCLKHMYTQWRVKEERSVSGTQYFSNEELLDAIYKASEVFRGLPDDQLFEAFSKRPDIIYDLSDENLWEELYKITRIPPENMESRAIRHRREANRSNRFGEIDFENTYISSRFDFPSRGLPMSEYDSFREYKIRNPEHLYEARIYKYGIPDLPFENICKEYQRRKTSPKIFDNLYAKDIYNKLKNNEWDSNKFKSRADFCATFTPGQQ